MATCPITLKVHVAWWIKPYCYLLSCFCAITGMEPDMEKIERTIHKGITIRSER